jgi:hypothetical protein
MCDKLVFDLSQEIEGSPSVFIRKDWISILDNQNQNYNNNQSIIDTSQICNSNKYMSYREAYLSIPFLLTLGTQNLIVQDTAGVAVNLNGTNPAFTANFEPDTTSGSADSAIGLKNWFGQIIHSFTLDYNGTTIIQQTPYVNMWNSFRLLTSMSLDDINVQGPTIGFFPDSPLTWQYITPQPNISTGPIGNGTCNNSNSIQNPTVNGRYNNFRAGGGNEGFLQRQYNINFDLEGNCGNSPASLDGANPINTPYGSLIAGGSLVNPNGAIGSMNLLWKSYITNKQNQTTAVLNGIGGRTDYPDVNHGTFQISVVATVYLKHIHSFFNFCPLIKGAFMKMTMNLNNTTTSFQTTSLTQAGVDVYSFPTQISCTQVQNPLGGVNPLMIASGAFNPFFPGGGNPLDNILEAPAENNGGNCLFFNALTAGVASVPAIPAFYATINYRLNISVGANCLDQTLRNSNQYNEGQLSRSIYLYIPSYTFNPPFEQAYLSNPVKNIKYTDIYQYQVVNIGSNQVYNNLITNGIANIKSVLVLPFYSATNNSAGNVIVGELPSFQTTVNGNTGFLNGVPVWQSPFDPAGTGPTSPLCWITNFNVQVSGQNAIYNTEKYNFEQYNNQLYGQNAVNGGMTDGLNSGLISRQHFDMCYNYYYVNVERMLPAEQSVPKSIQLIGQNLSAKAIDLMVFIEFGVDTINIDILTGARV